MELRAYQREAIDRIRGAYAAGHRSVLFVLPTGGGKTFTFAHIVAGAVAKGRRTLILAHRYELIDQIRGAVPDDPLVQVSMVQSATRRLASMEPPQFIVTDEAHHASAASYRRIYEAFPNTPHLGVTATPRRTDGSGLGELFTSLVEGPTVRDLIDDGHLADYRIFAPPDRIDLKGVRKRGGDFARGDLAEAVDQPQITGDAIVEYERHARDQRAVVFCVNVEHARHVAERFTEAGHAATCVDGSLARDDRDARIEAFRRGDTPILTSCDLIGEGFDVPAIEAAILLRPTESLIVYLQQCGRALRPAPGKDRAVILDCVGNSERHGLPCDARSWSLQGREKLDVDANAPVKLCDECFAVVPASVLYCPECGATFPAAGDGPVEKVDLEEIDKVARAQEHERIAALPYRQALAEIAEPADIKKVARARGYKPGWSIRQAMERFQLDPWQAAKTLGYKPGIVFVLGLHERRP